MITRRRSYRRWAFVVLAASPAACGSDDSAPPPFSGYQQGGAAATSGNGGGSGAAGIAGSAGTAGTAGSGGTGGAAGGASGESGNGGAGQSGASGQAGTGQSGASGNAGAGAGGISGAGGAGGSVQCSDCTNLACAGQSCGANGLTCDTHHACSCPSGVTTEAACGDGVDNDCNGMTDCQDPACAGQSCGNSGQTCQTGSCMSNNDAYTLALVAADAAIPADGAATTTITLTLTSSKGASVANQAVTFAIAGPGTFQDSGANTFKTQTSPSGVVSATFLSDAGGGTATISATVANGESTTTTVSMPQLIAIQALPLEYSVMGVKSSGFNESQTVKFEALGPNNTPYPKGLKVTLSHTQIGGSALGTPTNTCSTPGCTVTFNETTDAQGVVGVPFYSGTLAGSARIGAMATAAGQTISASQPASIPIIGAKASGARLSLTCSPGNVPALADTTCTQSKVDLTVSCVATLADRFGNVLGKATTVSLNSEAGSAGQPVSTPDYDPKSQTQTGLGRATGVITTLGAALPIDVDPTTDQTSGKPEYSLAADFGCGPLTHNPRDGVSSIIMIVQGEEGFSDTNGNGVYDQGEPFIDLPEPYVDANDNNTHDDGEFFLDVDQSGSWTPPNGTWDGGDERNDTVVWAETRIVYTSGPAVVSNSQGTEYFSRFFVPPASPPAPSSHLSFFLTKDSPSIFIDAFFTDQNFNVMSATSTNSQGVTFGQPSIPGSNPVSATLVSGIQSNSELGFQFKQQYCDGDASGSPTCSTTFPPAGVIRSVRQSSFSNFSYGSTGQISVSASGNAASFPVDLTATLFNKTTTIVANGSASGFQLPSVDFVTNTGAPLARASDIGARWVDLHSCYRERVFQPEPNRRATLHGLDRRAAVSGQRVLRQQPRLPNLRLRRRPLRPRHAPRALRRPRVRPGEWALADEGPESVRRRVQPVRVCERRPGQRH